MKIFVISLTYKLSSGGSKNFRTEGAVEFFGSDIPYDFIEIEVDSKIMTGYLSVS